MYKIPSSFLARRHLQKYIFPHKYGIKYNTLGIILILNIVNFPA